MLILTIRTDNPDAELGLYEDGEQRAYQQWQAHRELSNTIHQKIKTMLSAQSRTIQDIAGIVCFQGPGSFTGLRIGITVADTFAYGLSVPIVATMGDDWIADGVRRLQDGENDKIVLPHYGAPVHITAPRK